MIHSDSEYGSQDLHRRKVWQEIMTEVCGLQAQSMPQHGVQPAASYQAPKQADDVVITESPQSVYSGPMSPETALSPTPLPKLVPTQNSRIAMARQWSHAKLSNMSSLPPQWAR
jgi:hypothetical protein